MPKALHIHATDNIAVCTSAVQPGDEVEILEPDGSRGAVPRTFFAPNHKMNSTPASDAAR